LTRHKKKKKASARVCNEKEVELGHAPQEAGKVALLDERKKGTHRNPVKSKTKAKEKREDRSG